MAAIIYFTIFGMVMAWLVLRTVGYYRRRAADRRRIVRNLEDLGRALDVSPVTISDAESSSHQRRRREPAGRGRSGGTPIGAPGAGPAAFRQGRIGALNTARTVRATRWVTFAVT